MTPVARFLVGMAVHRLPVGACRDRYRQEFLAELSGMRPVRQVLHGLALLATAPALRVAVIGADHPSLTMVSLVEIRPVWHCWLRLGHAWSLRFSEDGGRYLQCARCNTDRGVDGGPSDGWAYLSWPLMQPRGGAG